MKTRQAIPGTIVPSGSQVSPGGEQGPPGSGGGGGNIGVIDGSEAAAGEIGEYKVFKAMMAIHASNDAASSIHTASIPAGDWDVDASVFCQAVSGANVVSGGAFFSIQGAPTNPDTIAGSVATGMMVNCPEPAVAMQNYCLMHLGPLRLNLSAPTTLTLFLTTMFAGMAASGFYVNAGIRIRRMR